MNEIILVTIVICCLLLIITTLILYVIKRVNLLTKSIFIDKLSQLDFLLEDKEKKLDELNKQISDNENKMIELEKKIGEYKNNDYNDTKKSDVVLPRYVDFEDDNLLSNYKAIKEKFNYNVDAILNAFINDKNYINDFNKYKVYERIRSYFSYDVIYKLETYQKNDQLLIISNLLNDEEKNLLNPFLIKENFNLKRFLAKLDDLLVKTDPKIVVTVGDKSKNYDKINSRIITVYDENIIEGFRIYYKGIVYDFSI